MQDGISSTKFLLVGGHFGAASASNRKLERWETERKLFSFPFWFLGRVASSFGSFWLLSPLCVAPHPAASVQPNDRIQSMGAPTPSAAVANSFPFPIKSNFSTPQLLAGLFQFSQFNGASWKRWPSLTAHWGHNWPPVTYWKRHSRRHRRHRRHRRRRCVWPFHLRRPFFSFIRSRLLSAGCVLFFRLGWMFTPQTSAVESGALWAAPRGGALVRISRRRSQHHRSVLSLAN